MRNTKPESGAEVRLFTLIELLIAVAIIAILMALLLPALTSSKHQAKRVVCISQERQFGLAFSLYAEQREDFVPLGYGTVKQYTYYLYRLDQNRFGAQAQLYLNGVLTDSRSYGCPASLSRLPNNWPPGSVNASTWGDFGVRPGSWNWNNGMPVLPKLRDMNRKPLLTDSTAYLKNLTNGHIQGINSLWADGSVRWVPAQLILSDLIQFPVHPAPLQAAMDPVVDHLWSILDGVE